MRFIGYVTTVVVAAILAAGLVVAVVSIPDIKRYLAMRRM